MKQRHLRSGRLLRDRLPGPLQVVRSRGHRWRLHAGPQPGPVLELSEWKLIARYDYGQSALSAFRSRCVAHSFAARAMITAWSRRRIAGRCVNTS